MEGINGREPISEYRRHRKTKPLCVFDTLENDFLLELVVPERDNFRCEYKESQDDPEHEAFSTDDFHWAEGTRLAVVLKGGDRVLS